MLKSKALGRSVGRSGGRSGGLDRRPSFAVISAIFFVGTFAISVAHASSYIVGNGDDGSDLEGGRRVTSGILIETRARALDRVRRLNAPAVDHLGTLLPELEKSDLYLVDRGIHAKMKDDRGLESSPDGAEVYARTFAEPHAATRFFPAALTLNEEQLIALHIHEALHRALPENFRENEAIVTKITLALAATDSSTDRVRRVVASELRGESQQGPTGAASENGDSRTAAPGLSARAIVAEKDEATEQSSSVTYRYTSFFLPHDGNNQRSINSLHSLATEFYPIGGRRILGLGMEFSYITMQGQAFMGPLTLSARGEIAKLGHYDVNAFASLSLNTMAGEEIKNSPLGRDVTTLGLSFRRDESRYYIEDSVQVSLEGEAKRKVGLDTQTFHYGKVVAAAIHAGTKLRGFELGGFAELLLSDSYRTTGGAIPAADANADSGRFRIFGVGPELSYITGAMRYSLNARWVLDSTPGANLDEIGDLIGYGLGQGSVGASATLRF